MLGTVSILNYILQIDTALAQSVGDTVNKVGGDTTNEFSKLVGNFLAQIPLWIVAFIVAGLSYFVAILVRRSIENKLSQEGIEEEHREIQIMAGRSSYFIVLTLGITIALSIVGIDLKPIVAAGAFGLGFALQDIIMNLIAGMMILASRHYSIGDVINVSGITGKIEEIQTRATIIKAFDGTKVIVPNAELFKNVVISKTSNPYRKLSFMMGVGYGTNLKDVMELTLSVVKAVPWVLKKPKPSVIFSEWGDSSINFKINVWIDSKGGKFVKTKNQVIMDLTKAYDESGIDIPWPITTLNFDMADHSQENEDRVSKKIKSMRKALKQKTLDSNPQQSFPALQQAPLTPVAAELAPQTASQVQYQQTTPVLQNQPLLVSPTPTVNSSAQGWLEQALAQQMSTANPAPAQNLPSQSEQPQQQPQTVYNQIQPAQPIMPEQTQFQPAQQFIQPQPQFQTQTQQNPQPQIQQVMPQEQVTQLIIPAENGNPGQLPVA
jgi:small-conductance mechanosensitive channel